MAEGQRTEAQRSEDPTGGHPPGGDKLSGLQSDQQFSAEREGRRSGQQRAITWRDHLNDRKRRKGGTVADFDRRRLGPHSEAVYRHGFESPVAAANSKWDAIANVPDEVERRIRDDADKICLHEKLDLCDAIGISGISLDLYEGLNDDAIAPVRPCNRHGWRAVCRVREILAKDRHGATAESET